MTEDAPSSKRTRSIAAYSAMLVAAGALLWLVRTLGHGLTAPTSVAGQVPREVPGPVNGTLFHVLVALLVVTLALSVTAFPVLARILTDRGLQRTPLAVVAISCIGVLMNTRGLMELATWKRGSRREFPRHLAA